MKRLPRTVALLMVVVFAGGFLLLRRSGSAEAPVQPIAFDHWQHVTSQDGPGLDCTFCHEHGDKSAHATIPNVDTCMTCHSTIAAEKEEIRKLTSISDKGEQPQWRRVYWFEQEADVFFTHKPHLRAQVECSVCHGDVANSHRVGRTVNQTMGWCIDCHRSKGASVDCYVCHR